MPSKNTKGQWLTTRVSSAVKQAVIAIAKEERRSTSQVIAILIEDALQRRTQPSKKEQAA